MSSIEFKYDDGGYWLAYGDCLSSFESGVFVFTGDQGISPTTVQVDVINLLTALPQQFVNNLKQFAKRYLVKQLLENGLASDHYDFRLELHQAIVPPISIATVNYFFLLGSSDADMDRGMAFLCKGVDSFAIVSCDYAHERLDWNAVEHFEMLMAYNDLGKDIV